jgi:guanylate kinase
MGQAYSMRCVSFRGQKRVNTPELAIPAAAQRAFAQVQAYVSHGPLLVVVSGPSGVGKDSVLKRMRELGYAYHFVVTATSRPARPGEVDGVDYAFCSTAEFECMIAAGELFEHALVYGQYKGIPKAHVRRALAAGEDALMRLDVQGAATIKRLVPQAVTIFVAPPTLEVLVERLRQRGGDTPEQLQQRLRTILAEMVRIEEFDYVVINHEGRLDEAAHQIGAIIAAEKCRTGRRRTAV